MSRVFTDDDLQNWEAYASGGAFGLPERPKVVFYCLSDRNRRARFVELEGDNAGAEDLVHSAELDRLRSMLAQSQPLE
jgi:hypothetical protein